MFYSYSCLIKVLVIWYYIFEFDSFLQGQYRFGLQWLKLRQTSVWICKA